MEENDWHMAFQMTVSNDNTHMKAALTIGDYVKCQHPTFGTIIAEIMDIDRKQNATLTYPITTDYFNRQYTYMTMDMLNV